MWKSASTGSCHSVPSLQQGSLGLAAHEFEYDEPSRRSISGDPRETVVSETFFGQDCLEGWHQIDSFSIMTKQNTALSPFTTCCAVARLTIH